MKVYTVENNVHCSPEFIKGKSEDELTMLWLKANLKALNPFIKARVIDGHDDLEGAKILVGRLNVVTYDE